MFGGVRRGGGQLVQFRADLDQEVRQRQLGRQLVQLVQVVADGESRAAGQGAVASTVSGEIERNWGMESGYVKERMVPGRQKYAKSVSDNPVLPFQYV